MEVKEVNIYLYLFMMKCHLLIRYPCHIYWRYSIFPVGVSCLTTKHDFINIIPFLYTFILYFFSPILYYDWPNKSANCVQCVDVPIPSSLPITDTDQVWAPTSRCLQSHEDNIFIIIIIWINIREVAKSISYHSENRSYQMTYSDTLRLIRSRCRCDVL